MLEVVIIAAVVSLAIGVTSYRYSVKKANEIIEKMERPDLIEIN